jgi:hypothetical protein
LLLKIYSSIRSNAVDVNLLIEAIRSSSNIESLDAFFENNVIPGSISILTPFKNPEQFATIQSLPPVCKDVLFRVPAQPWTTVTKSNLIVSHLISLFFTWAHPILNVCTRNLFLKDMAEVRYDYCSPLLVNAILSYASVSLFRNPTLLM